MVPMGKVFYKKAPLGNGTKVTNFGNFRSEPRSEPFVEIKTFVTKAGLCAEVRQQKSSRTLLYYSKGIVGLYQGQL